MAHDLIAPNAGSLATPGALAVPAPVMDAGEAAARRYVEFFAARIRNPNTRAAYARAASGFFGWCERHGLALAAVRPVHVAAWVEGLGREGLSAPSVRQRPWCTNHGPWLRRGQAGSIGLAQPSSG
jgi:hypothetical protein